MPDPGLSQQQYWNGPAAQRWIAGREQLDRSLATITDAVMTFAAPCPGERVLDLGCGCGTTTLLVRERVLPGGRVHGVDVSAPMLAVARARATTPDVDFTEADAATQRFPPAFDLAFSRFGVMFFDDPAAAFASIRGALAPGGRLAFVCWRAMADNPWVTAPLAAARDLLPPLPPLDTPGPGPFAFADRERLHGILTHAGFSRVRILAHDDVVHLGATAEEAAAHTLTVGPLARAAAELPDSVCQAIRARVTAALEPEATPRGVALAAALWLVGAE